MANNSNNNNNVSLQRVLIFSTYVNFEVQKIEALKKCSYCYYN